MLCGLLVIGGLMLAWTGLVPVPVTERRTRTRREREPIPPQRLAVIVAPGVALLLLTRWPVAAVGASVAAWFATSPALRQRNESADIADALTTWTEMLRDATGT